MKKKFTGASTPLGVRERPWATAEATRQAPVVAAQSVVTASSTSAHDAHSGLARRGLAPWRAGGLDGALGSGARRLSMPPRPCVAASPAWNQPLLPRLSPFRAVLANSAMEVLFNAHIGGQRWRKQRTSGRTQRDTGESMSEAPVQLAKQLAKQLSEQSKDASVVARIVALSASDDAFLTTPRDSSFNAAWPCDYFHLENAAFTEAFLGLISAVRDIDPRLQKRSDRLVPKKTDEPGCAVLARFAAHHRGPPLLSRAVCTPLQVLALLLWAPAGRAQRHRARADGSSFRGAACERRRAGVGAVTPHRGG